MVLRSKSSCVIGRYRSIINLWWESLQTNNLVGDKISLENLWNVKTCSLEIILKAFKLKFTQKIQAKKLPFLMHIAYKTERAFWYKTKQFFKWRHCTQIFSSIFRSSFHSQKCFYLLSTLQTAIPHCPTFFFSLVLFEFNLKSKNQK